MLQPIHASLPSTSLTALGSDYVQFLLRFTSLARKRHQGLNPGCNISSKRMSGWCWLRLV